MEVTKILKDNNFEFAKKFGQNFITDTNFLDAVVNDCNLSENDEVLEIGAGAGTLTRSISKRAKKVVSYEIDKRLESILQQTLNDLDNVELKFNDIMQLSLEEIEANFKERYTIIANLPYYITTPIIFKFLQSKKLKALNIMVQKEVAERIVAKSGKDYGILSIMIDYYGDAKISRIVNRNMFNPMPNVDSAIVGINLTRKYDCNSELFSFLVHKSFAMRRKTLYNNLKHANFLSDDDLKNVLYNFKEGIRAENLTVQDFVNLTNIIEDLKEKE